MRHEQQRPISAAGRVALASSAFVIAERARREAQIRELRTDLPTAVDLAKQPGLLCRLHAMLND